MYNKKMLMMQSKRENLRQQFKSRKSNITKIDVLYLITFFHKIHCNYLKIKLEYTFR